MDQKSEITNLSTNNEDNDNNDNNKDELDDEQKKISKDFKENVIKYVKLDDHIRKKMEEINELKKQKKPCEEYILKYMDRIGENMIEITDGKLRKNKAETKKALTLDIIKKAISTKIKTETDIAAIMELMETNRPLNTHVNLKRTGKHNKKKKTKKNEKDDNSDSEQDDDNNNGNNENI